MWFLGSPRGGHAASNNICELDCTSSALLDSPDSKVALVRELLKNKTVGKFVAPEAAPSSHSVYEAIVEHHL